MIHQDSMGSEGSLLRAKSLDIGLVLSAARGLLIRAKAPTITYSTPLELRDPINSLKSFGRRIPLLSAGVDQFEENVESLLGRQPAIVVVVRPASVLVTRELGPDALHESYLTAEHACAIVA
jgi:hypothetical protein